MDCTVAGRSISPPPVLGGGTVGCIRRWSVVTSSGADTAASATTVDWPTSLVVDADVVGGFFAKEAVVFFWFARCVSGLSSALLAVSQTNFNV